MKLVFDRDGINDEILKTIGRGGNPTLEVEPLGNNIKLFVKAQSKEFSISIPEGLNTVSPGGSSGNLPFQVAAADGFAALVSSMSGTGGTIWVATSQTITANLTVPDNITVIAKEGASFTGTFDLRFDGPFHGGKDQYFSSSNTPKVMFHSKSISGLWAEWWGAKSNIGAENFDSTTAFLAAIKSIRDGIDTFNSSMRTMFIFGSYIISQELHLPQDAGIIGIGSGLSSFTASTSFSFPNTGVAMIRSDGAVYNEPGPTRRIYLRNIYLNGNNVTGSNGILASQQQPAYWENIRIDNCKGYGCAIVDTQQLYIHNIEFIHNKDSMILRSAEFVWVYGFNADQATGTNIKFEKQSTGVSNNNNHFWGGHLEIGTSQTGPMIDIKEAAACSFDGFWITTGNITVFNSGPGSTPNTYTLRNINFQGNPAQSVGINDQDRSISWNADSDLKRYVAELHFANTLNGYAGPTWSLEGNQNSVRSNVADGVPISITKSTDSGIAFSTRKHGDTQDRFNIAGNGKVLLGSGTVAPTAGLEYGGTNFWQVPVNTYAKGTFIPNRRLVVTTAGTTVDCTGYDTVELNPPSVTTYTNFTMTDNQEVQIICGNNNVRINNGSPFIFLSAGNFVGVQNATIRLKKYASLILQIARNV